MLALLTQTLPSAVTSVPEASRRASALSRAGLEDSGRTGAERGSEPSSPVPETAQCSIPPKSRTTQGLKTSRSKSWLAAPSFARSPPEGLPWSETARNASDILFVHFEAAPIVCPGWATKKSATTT